MCVDAKTGGGEGPNLDVQNLLSWPEKFCRLPFRRIAVSILTLEIKLIKTSVFSIEGRRFINYTKIALKNVCAEFTLTLV